MRTRTAVLTVLAGVLCAPAPAALRASQIVLVDDSGVEIRLAAPARRIVSLAPSNTESLFAIGAGELIVGATRFDAYPPAAQSIPRVGGFADVDAERVLQVRPDLVLAAGFQRGGVVPRLRSLGLTVFVVEPRDAHEVLDRLETLGELVGRRQAAVQLAASLRARLMDLRRRVGGAPRRPRVLFMLSRDLFTVGPGSFIHSLIETAGGENIASDLALSYPQLSDEAVIARDPEVIFVGSHEVSAGLEELAQRAGWRQVSAVRRGRVFVLQDPDRASRPGPRIVDALEEIAEAIREAAEGAATAGRVQ